MELPRALAMRALYLKVTGLPAPMLTSAKQGKIIVTSMPPAPTSPGAFRAPATLATKAMGQRAHHHLLLIALRSAARMHANRPQGAFGPGIRPADLVAPKMAEEEVVVVVVVEASHQAASARAVLNAPAELVVAMAVVLRSKAIYRQTNCMRSHWTRQYSTVQYGTVEI